MKKELAAVTVMLAIAGLSACSSDAPAPAGSEVSEVESTPTAETPVEHVGDAWSFEYMGATGSFSFADAAAGDVVPQLEAARVAVGAPEVTYLTVNVDNTAGTVPLNMYGLTVVTLEGQQVTSVPVSDVLSEWRGATSDDQIELYNSIVDLNNAVGQFDLRPGAKGTAVLTFAEPVTSAAKVYVQPAGGTDEVEASAE